MSNPMDTEPPTGNASSSSASAPKKPSIRVLDQHPEALATREEDLANGPSLLCLGDGVGGHEYPTLYSVPQLDSELESGGLGHHHHYPVTRMLPEIPSGLPTASSLQVSESSATGPSMSVPTDSLSTSDDRAAGLFVRAYEFSWENSRLCFAGEPLNVVRATEDQYSKVDPDSKTASLASGDRTQSAEGDGTRPADGDGFAHLAGIGSFDDTTKSWVASEFSQDLETALKTCVVSDAGSSSDTVSEGDLDTSALDPQRILGYLHNIDSLVELLVEDFLRSYAPQKSQKRNNTAQRQAAQGTVGDPDTVTGTSSTSTRGNIGSRKRKAIGGSGESDDEGSRDDGQGTSSAKNPKSSRRFACPFLKWRPRMYSKCDKKLKEMSHVKHHLRTVHREIYCPECFASFGQAQARQDQVLPKEERPAHHCDANSDPPISLITVDKFEEIRVHANSLGMTHREQWYRLFGVLFPDEPQCSSPYLDIVDEQKMDDIEEYMGSERSHRILGKGANEMGFGSKDIAKIKELVFERWIPEVMAIYRPEAEVYCSGRESVKPAHDDDGAIEYHHPSDTLDLNAISINTEDTSSYGLQQLPNLATAAQAYPAQVLAGPSVSMPGVFETHTRIEGSASGEPTDTTGTEDLGLTGPDTVGPMADGYFSRLLASEGHHTYETELDPAWNLSLAY